MKRTLTRAALTDLKEGTKMTYTPPMSPPIECEYYEGVDEDGIAYAVFIRAAGIGYRGFILYENDFKLVSYDG